MKRLPVSSQRLGAVILVVAALSVGRVITQFLPETELARPFERTTTVGKELSLRYADVTATEVAGGRRTDDGTVIKESPGIWVVVRLTVTPTLEKSTFAYAEMRTRDGAVLLSSTRAEDSCPSTNPGIPTPCVIAFEIAPDDAPGARLALTHNLNDQRADDMAVIDLGISKAQVAAWRTRTEPIKTQLVIP